MIRPLSMALVLMMGMLSGKTGEEASPPEAVAEASVAEELVLPQWSPEDWELVKSGELVPGSSIFGEIAYERLFSDNQEPIEFDPSVRDLPDLEPEVEHFPTVIDDEFLARYFREAPKGYLVDPQGLLTNQEFQDREGFLSYHARDTEIDLYIYLFDTKQKLPVGEGLENVLAEHFSESGPIAVAFYFLGMPDRSELVFSKGVKDAVAAEEMTKVLPMAIDAAFEKSDPISQLESFSIQLSIRLYWMEKVLAEDGRLDRTLAGSSLLVDVEEEMEVDPGMWVRLKSSPPLYYTVMSFFAFVVLSIIGLLIKFFSDRGRVYVFPDAEGSPLMEAPHAAGVGSVISYANRTLPPSSQRDEVPDYLQRL